MGSYGLRWVQMGSDRFLGRMERGEVASMNSSGIWSGAGRAGGRTRRRRTRLNGELDLRGGGEHCHSHYSFYDLLFKILLVWCFKCEKLNIAMGYLCNLQIFPVLHRKYWSFVCKEV
jgi:hypothetical protein